MGQDTETVSRQLRIRAIYLRAIEEGRIQDLPGATYAVGFVRSYADFLGFDGNSVVASFRDELGQKGRPETVSWQIEDRDGGFPFFKILVVLAVIAGAGYGLWWYLANTQSGSGLIEAVPEYLKKSTGAEKAATPTNGQGASAQSPDGQATNTQTSSGQAPAGQTPLAQPGNAVPPTAGTTTETPAPATSTPETTGQATPPASTGSPAPAAPPPATADQQAENKTAGQAGTPTAAPAEPSAGAPTATTAPATGQATPTQPAANQPAANPPAANPPAGSEAAPEVAAAASSPSTRISVHAKLESWVQITDKDGKPVLSRVLRAGETYAVPDEKGLVMNTGNAGGIDLLVDGKALPSLGSVGLVKRNIMLDADKLAAGSVTTKAPAGKTDGAEAPAAPAD